VELTFAEAPADFQEQVSFTGIPCCAGLYYVSPPSADPIEVPDVSDAGGTE
jgi:hypothetical protein